MSPVTPPRPLDVTAVIPQLAPLARTATRLHPRPGSPSPGDSSVGGPLLWPAGEPWPHCHGPHPAIRRADAPQSPEEVRQLRRDRAAAAGRHGPGRRPPGRGPRQPAAGAGTGAERPWPEGPVAMLPVAQLYTRDIPDLRPPGRSEADLLQILWCPFNHPAMPRTVLFWRSSAAVTDILTAPPEPSAVRSAGYVPEPCVLTPERITEFPNPMDLDSGLRDALGDPATWQAAGVGGEGPHATVPEEFYRNDLSVAPGWKVGGWPFWGPTDPTPRLCTACGTEMTPLLTIATFEWDHDTRGWSPDAEQAGTGTAATGAGPEGQAVLDFFQAQGIPVHDRGRVRRSGPAQPVTDPALREPTAVRIGDGQRQQLYYCPLSPEHPHAELMQ